jgi:hypothetical protein
MNPSTIIGGCLCLLLLSSCAHNPSQGTVFGYRYDPNKPYIQPSHSSKPPTKTTRKRTQQPRQPDVEIYSPEESIVKNRTLGANNEPKAVVISVVDKAPPEAVIAERPGFVRSPHAPEAGLIDIRGYPPGTEVQDPYSGKPFLVPSVN